MQVSGLKFGASVQATRLSFKGRTLFAQRGISSNMMESGPTCTWHSEPRHWPKARVLSCPACFHMGVCFLAHSTWPIVEVNVLGVMDETYPSWDCSCNAVHALAQYIMLLAFCYSMANALLSPIWHALPHASPSGVCDSLCQLNGRWWSCS